MCVCVRVQSYSCLFTLLHDRIVCRCLPYASRTHSSAVPVPSRLLSGTGSGVGLLFPSRAMGLSLLPFPVRICRPRANWVTGESKQQRTQTMEGSPWRAYTLACRRK